MSLSFYSIRGTNPVSGACFTSCTWYEHAERGSASPLSSEFHPRPVYQVEVLFPLLLTEFPSPLRRLIAIGGGIGGGVCKFSLSFALSFFISVHFIRGPVYMCKRGDHVSVIAHYSLQCLQCLFICVLCSTVICVFLHVHYLHYFLSSNLIFPTPATDRVILFALM